MKTWSKDRFAISSLHCFHTPTGTWAFMTYVSSNARMIWLRRMILQLKASEMRPWDIMVSLVLKDWTGEVRIIPQFLRADRSLPAQWNSQWILNINYFQHLGSALSRPRVISNKAASFIEALHLCRKALSAIWPRVKIVLNTVRSTE